MTESSISTETKTRPHKTAHAQIYDWQLVRLRQAGNRGSLAIEILIKLAEKVGRGAKPSDPWYSPSIETLAASLFANERSIRRSIGLLARHGLIEITKSQNGRNLYRLSTSPDEAERWQAATASTLCKGHARRVADNSKNGGATCPPRADIFVHPERTYSSNRADIFVQPSGHIRPTATNDPSIINAANIDNNDEKQTKKTEPIRQYLHTEETNRNNKQQFSQISKPHEPSSAAVVVVKNFFAMSQETKPTAEPMNDDHNLRFGETKGRLETCIRQFGDAQIIGSNFGDDCEYQYWPEYENPKTLEAFTVEQVLDHYKLNAKLPHIAKALKEAQGRGIPTIELSAAIVWKLKEISTTQNGGLAWNMLDRNLVGIWNQWQQYTTQKLERAASKQRQAEQKRKNEQQRQAEREHEANERIAQRIQQDAENERLAAIHAERMQKQAEHDAKPENIILRTQPKLSQLETELEQEETKYQQRLAERAAEALKLESGLNDQANGTLWRNKPEEWEAVRSMIIKESRKNIPTEDAEHAQKIANITRAIANAQNTIAQAEKALAEAA